ncbi:hypothetical protein DINM_002214 [Dirofilaria immitis]|nr:hypothetical protein [Dirofilaria immitis]
MCRPWQDSNLQSSDPKSDALSIGPQGPKLHTHVVKVQHAASELLQYASANDNVDESSRPDEGTGKVEEGGFNNGHISNDLTNPSSHLSLTTAMTRELKRKTRKDVKFDESNC